MSPARGRSDEGFILVVVLVLLMALASLASIYSVYARNAAAESMAPEDRLRGDAAIRSAVELAALQLLSHAGAKRPSHGQFPAFLGDIRIEVAYRAENARVDLNEAPKEMLAGLFTHLGWSDDEAAGFADRILGWRTEVQPNAANAEPEAYRKAGVSYAPRQAPFNDVSELSLVLGVPRDLPARAAPYLTIYSGGPQINVEEADPLILASLPEVNADALAATLAARAKGAEDATLINLLGNAGQAVVAEPGQAYRAEIRVGLRNRTLHAEVVFTLKIDSPNPYEILHWSDDFDGPQSFS